MQIVMRLLYWSTLFATTLALVLPVVGGGRGYQISQPVVILGLLATFAFGVWALPKKGVLDGTSPFDQAMRRRRAGLVYSLLAFVVIGVASTIEFIAAYGELEHLRNRELDAAVMAAIEDAAAGSWTGIIGFVAAGVAFIVWMVFIASKPRHVHPPPYGHPAAW